MFEKIRFGKNVCDTKTGQKQNKKKVVNKNRKTTQDVKMI